MTLPTDCSRTRSRILAAGVLLALLAVAVTGAATGQAAPKRIGATAAKPKRPYTTLPQRASLRTLFTAVGDTQAPTSPSHLATKESSQSTITLGWRASRDNVAVTGYGAYVNGLRVGSTKAKPPSFQFARLSCGRTYGLGIDAYDAAGNRSRTASVLSATAPCVDTSPPTVPAGLRQTGTGQIGVTIEWNGSTDDVGVAGYRVYREGVPVGVTQQQSLWLGGLVCGAGYAVSVEAFDAAGNRSARAQLVVTTAACPIDTPPSAPSDLAVTDASTTSVTVSWRAASDDFGVAGYRTSIDGTSTGTTTATLKTFAGLECGRSYLVELVAVDAAGGTSPPASLIATTRSCDGSTGGSTQPPSGPSGDTQAPSAPTSIAQVARTETSITLTWQLATDNVGVAGYRVYRDGAQIGTTVVPPYTATGLACGRSYTFSLEAYDAAGNHSSRPATMLTTSACSDTIAPSAPGSLRQSGSTATSVSVSWDAAADNTGVAGYTLFIGGPAAGTTAQTSYSFAGLACSTSYTISVEAFDAAGNRSPRVSLSATTAACDAVPPPTGSVYVTPDGSDANPCTQASPCRTFGRAYKAASAGATVVVGAGTYPGQEIDEDPSKPASGAPVVFEPSGPVIVDGTLDFGQDQFDRLGPANVTVRNMKITYMRSWPGSSGLVWENIDAAHFDVFDSTNVTIRGGDYGPCQAPRDDPSCVSRIAGTSSNILVEGVNVHDITSTDLVNYHVDGMFIRGGSNIVIRNSKFWGNMVTNIRIQEQPCCANANLLIENNWFNAPLQGDGVSPRADAINVDTPVVGGVTIQFNSFAENAGPQVTAPAVIKGNLMQNATCSAGVTYSYNVFIPFSPYTGQTACGPTDKKVSTFGYVANSPGGAFDYRLQPGATSAVDYVPTTNACPAGDFEGTARPQGGACDAGADER